MSEKIKWLNYYLEFCKKQKNLNDKTIKAYRIDLNQFLGFLSRNGSDITLQSIREYTMSLHDSYKVRSIKRKISSIKAWTNFLFENEFITCNPFYHWHVKLRQPLILPRTIPLQVIQNVLNAAHLATRQANSMKEECQAWRETAVLELLFATGMRVSELCGLKNDDIDFIERAVRIYGKGSKERIVHLENNEVLRTLSIYKHLEPSKSGESFFKNRLSHPLSDQSVRMIVRKYALKAGCSTHITPHMFRHSFATLLLEEDVDIRYIQKFLGHSSITTTQIYTFVAAAKQRNILAARHPRNKFTFE